MSYQGLGYDFTINVAGQPQMFQVPLEKMVDDSVKLALQASQQWLPGITAQIVDKGTDYFVSNKWPQYKAQFIADASSAASDVTTPVIDSVRKQVVVASIVLGSVLAGGFYLLYRRR